MSVSGGVSLAHLRNSPTDPLYVQDVGGGGGGTQDVNIVSSIPLVVNTGLMQGTTPADTQPISAVNLPLPTGAATAAKQLPDNHQVTVSNFPATQPVSGTVSLSTATLNALESITVQNGAGAAAVNIQDGGNSITIDGTVSVGNFPATQVVSATDLDIRNLSSAQDSVAVTDGGGSLTVDGAVSINNFPATQAVSGTVTANLGTLNGAATAAKQLPDNHFVKVSNVLVPSEYDQIDLSYTGTNVTGVVYKKLGATVATLTLSYTGDNLTSVVRT